MKLGLVAVPGIPQPGYPGHFTFNTNIFGRRNKQYSERRRGGAGRAENARSVRAKLGNLGSIKFSHPRQEPRPLTTRRPTASRHAGLFWIIEFLDGFNVVLVEVERLNHGASRRRVRQSLIG